MQIIPAIDLKDNKCVRLSKGADDTSTIFNDDPRGQAVFFENAGCKKLHVVDLDAAFGRPDININSIKKIRDSINIPIQLGGGIRNYLDADKYFNLGIDNLIIGSMSANNPETLKKLADKYENKIYVSLDIKENVVMIKGWKEKSKLKLEDILTIYKQSEIRGYVITDIKNDGMLKGLNINFIKETIDKIQAMSEKNKQLILAGGLTDYNDLKELKKLDSKSIEGIISGKSFYVGNINLKKAQNILDNNA